VRFTLLVQKAAEICQEVKSLGNNLLATLEKEDNEALVLLRARHERMILEVVENVRYAQWQDAIKASEGLLKSLANAVQRYTYYERQLGAQASEITVPELDALDIANLAKFNFKAEEPEMLLRNIEIDIATDAFAQAAQFLNGGKLLSSHEVRESLLLEAGQLATDIANILSVAGSIAHLFPTAKVHAQPMGVGGTVEYGGRNIGDGLGAGSAAARAVAERLNFEARRASRIDSFARREREWAFQSNLAAGEITQIYKQLRGAQIREAVAEREWRNHQQQIKNAEEIEFFLTGEKNPTWKFPIDLKEAKLTNQAFYTWLKREVRGIYGQCFQLAFEIAKKAERALQHELGNSELSFLQFGYQSGKEGLLAGEKLYLDIKRMEMAAYDLNRREYELTKHVSLLQLDPLALLTLRATGRCTVVLPEALFDMDSPGHYFRRIKTAAVSIPCITGPYTSVNCRLTLLKSSIRKNSLLAGNSYERSAEDTRFSDHFGSLDAIVTSSGQNDGGLFETNLRDERYLPFENSGVISEWQLELPADPSKGEPQQFDYNTISDVILHIRYTAREGGSLLRNGAIAHLANLIQTARAVGSIRMFSIRYEFPDAWAKFKLPLVDGRAELSLTWRAEHYPFWSKGRLDEVKRLDLYAKPSSVTPDTISISQPQPDNTQKTDTLSEDPLMNELRVGTLTGGQASSANGIPLPAPIGPFTLFFDDNSIEDLWLAVAWGKGD
jgi:hypothetical protein